jgi:hypothetical protein
MKIEIQNEELDAFVREGLYDAYDTIFSNVRNDIARLKRVGNARGLEQDIENNTKRLEAIELLLRYFDNEWYAEKRITEIEEKILKEEEVQKYRLLLKTMRA